MNPVHDLTENRLFGAHSASLALAVLRKNAKQSRNRSHRFYRATRSYCALSSKRLPSQPDDSGFKSVLSRHSSTNNAILIPKLRLGFLINGMSIDAASGDMVHLIYPFDERERQCLEIRGGQRWDAAFAATFEEVMQ
jgi:hypothetical protein